MPISNNFRFGSCALPLVTTLMTGVSVFAFFPSPSLAQANPEAGSGHYYFFGDSATGQGNWSAIIGSRGEDHYPYSSNNGYMRETNGLIWAEMLDRDVDIILDPDRDSPNLNFAISGAHMTRGGDLLQFGIETGVETQTELFGGLVDNGVLSIGDNDVAFMLAGGNDYLDRLEMDDPADEIMADIADATARNVRRLADAGVKTIILSEMQPIQYAPQYADEPEVRAALADLVAETNAAMFDAVRAESLPSDVNIVTMKYTHMVSYITSNAADLGFSNVNGSCVDQVTDEVCSPEKEVQDRFLFLDDLHFTERAQRLEAQWWMATLDGANGTAAGQTARMPRLAFAQYQNQRRYIRPGTHTDMDETFGVWLVPMGSSFNLKANGRQPKANASQNGIVMGAEGRFSKHFVVGGAFSVGDTKAEFTDAGQYKLKGGSLSLYGALDYQTDGRLSLTMTRGAQDIDDIVRVTGVDLLNASGATDSSFWDVEIAARSTDRLGSFEIDHGLALAAGRVKVDGYTETGADGLAIRFDDQVFNYRTVSLDSIIRGPDRQVSDTLTVRPMMDMTYTYQFGDDDYALTSQLIDNTAQAVTIRSNAPTEDLLDIGVGAELSLQDHWGLSLRYGRQWANDIDGAEQTTISLRTSF
ncbi:MAG: autotransporter domain-containing protein [Parvularcula sp.]